MAELAQYLWLRSSIRVIHEDGDLILIDPAGEVIQLTDPSSVALALVEQLNGEHSCRTLAANPYYPVLMPLLAQRGWVATMQRPLGALLDTYPALSREIAAFAHLYPEDLDRHFESISTKHVLVVGVGGIGSNVAFALCANGVGTLTIVDPDMVEPSNLNRQFLYAAVDVGGPKVDIAARELMRRFPQTSVHSVCEDFDRMTLPTSLIETADLVVVCGESSLLYDHPELCGHTPLMMSGYQGSTGVVGPLIDPDRGTACWSCVMEHHGRSAMRLIEACSRPRQYGWNPSGFVINSLTGSLCSSICVGVLSEQLSAKQWLGVRLRVLSGSLTIERSQVEPTRCAHSQVVQHPH